VDPSKHNYLQKAHQFFLPGAKGHIKEADVLSLLDSVDITQTPEVLKDGFVITAATAMVDYLPDDIDKTLSRILGVPVRIDFSIGPYDLIDFLGKRDFDAYSIATSMSYKVLGETLNLTYTSKSPTLVDPTRKIHDLLEKYQKTDEPAEEQNYTHEILKQMTLDAECIPLIYIAQPFFYNKERLNGDDLYNEESPQFWKMKVLD